MDEEVNLLVTSLNNCKIIDDNDPDKCIELMEKLLTINNEQKPLTYETDYKQLIIDNVIAILKLIDNNPLRIRTTKLIADASRNEFHRKHLTNNHLFQQLLKTLCEITCKKDSTEWLSINCINFDLLTQICRAFGNIFYNNEEARMMMVNLNGDEILINLMDLMDFNLKTDVQHKAFVNARGGLIPNLLLGSENISLRAIRFHILNKIENTFTYLLATSSPDNLDENSEYIIHTLSTLSVLTENVTDLTLEPRINLKIIEILDKTKLQEIFELCLELIHYQAENDDVKLYLAEAGFCVKLFERIDTYTELARTNEAGHLVKLACDILVLILTGDEAMKILYKTKLLQYMVDWLNSSDPELLATGILALGNFARSDSHCIYMVENKIALKLIEILRVYNERNEFDLRMEHALLSTLRNLVIPKINKEYMIKNGLVQNLLPMVKTQQPTVIYKLLGTFRMAIEGQQQTARDLLQNEFLLSQLVLWSRDSDFPSVSCESYRLMAWLIQHAFHARRNDTTKLESATSSSSSSSVKIDGDKEKSQSNDDQQNQSKIDIKLSSNSTTTTTTTESTTSNNPTESVTPIMLTSEECLLAFIKVKDTVFSMVNMITSPHLIMQNEALIALCIISAILDNKKLLGSIDLAQLFIESKLGDKLIEFITKYSETMTKEIVENLQTFIKLLRKSETLVAYLQTFNIEEIIKSIPIITEYCTL